MYVYVGGRGRGLCARCVHTNGAGFRRTQERPLYHVAACRMRGSAFPLFANPQLERKDLNIHLVPDSQASLFANISDCRPPVSVITLNAVVRHWPMTICQACRGRCSIVGRVHIHCLLPGLQRAQGSRTKPATGKRTAAGVVENQLPPLPTPAIKHAAACLIQRCYRRSRALRSLRITLAARQTAACTIQRAWRGWARRRRASECERRRRDAAVVIQRRVRGWEAGPRARASHEIPGAQDAGHPGTPQGLEGTFQGLKPPGQGHPGTYSDEAAHRVSREGKTSSGGLPWGPHDASPWMRGDGDSSDVPGRARTAPHDPASADLAGQSMRQFESTCQGFGENTWLGAEGARMGISGERVEDCRTGHGRLTSHGLTSLEHAFKSFLHYGGSSRGQRRRRAAVVIQRYWRGWSARRSLGFNPGRWRGDSTAGFLRPSSQGTALASQPLLSRPGKIHV